MIKKYCPNCRKASYSACGEGQWICPSCAHDLTSEPIMPLNSIIDRVSRLSKDKSETVKVRRRHLSLVYSK